MECPKCNTKLIKDDLFCPGCGIKIDQKKDKDKKSYSNSKIKLYFSIGVVVIIITVFFWVSKISTNDLQKTICNEPYILVGTSCCLDQNKNDICDKDEGVAIQPEQITSTETPGERCSPVGSVRCITSIMYQGCQTSGYWSSTREVQTKYECVNNQLLYLKLECTEDKTEKCSDGSTIIVKECFRGKYEPTGKTCPTETIPNTPQHEEFSCSADVKITVNDVSYAGNKIDVTVENLKETVISSFIMRVSGSDGTDPVDVYETLGKLSVKTFSFEFNESTVGVVEKVDVIPQLEVADGVYVPCSDQHIVYNF